MEKDLAPRVRLTVGVGGTGECDPSAGAGFVFGDEGTGGVLRSGQHGQTRVSGPESSRRFCLSLYGQLCILPCIEPTLECPGLSVSTFSKFLRQTGARSFVRSSAVSDDRFVFRDGGDILVQIV